MTITGSKIVFISSRWLTINDCNLNSIQFNVKNGEWNIQYSPGSISLSHVDYINHNPFLYYQGCFNLKSRIIGVFDSIKFHHDSEFPEKVNFAAKNVIRNKGYGEISHVFDEREGLVYFGCVSSVESGIFNVSVFQEENLIVKIKLDLDK